MLTSTSGNASEEGWHFALKGYFTTWWATKEKARVANHPGGIQGWESKKFDLASQSRRRFRRECHAWRIHGLAAFCGSGSRGSNRLRLARRDRQVFPFADEGQAVLFFVPINANQVAKVNLLVASKFARG